MGAHGQRRVSGRAMSDAPARSPSASAAPAHGLPTSYFVRDQRIFPNVVLAPMEGVTDLSFRRLVREIGGVGLTCTEFVASGALVSGNKGRRNRYWKMCAFDEDERPVSIQLYGKDPATMADAARVVQDMGATIVDINMGCPSKKVCKNSGGSALMAEPELAVAIVKAVRAAITVPLTVKMRSGFDHGCRNAPELAHACQEEGAEAITIHWRTRADLYGGQRAVDKIAETKARLRVPVIGNGDVVDVPSAVRMFEDTGCDGVMVGRGAMRNPWSLLQISDFLAGRPITTVTAAEKERVLLAFLDTQFAKCTTEGGALGRFKKVANHFTRGVPHGAALLRMPVLRSQSREEAQERVRAYFSLLRRHEAGEEGVFERELSATALASR